MGGFSLVHWLIVAVVVLLLFGRGRISEFMGDFGKGIGAFRKGIAEDETSQLPAARAETAAEPVQADPVAPQAERR